MKKFLKLLLKIILVIGVCSTPIFSDDIKKILTILITGGF